MNVRIAIVFELELPDEKPMTIQETRAAMHEWIRAELDGNDVSFQLPGNREAAVIGTYTHEMED